MENAQLLKAMTFSEFWLDYLRVHARPLTRQTHYAAFTFSIVMIALSLIFEDYHVLVFAGVIGGYAIAWTGHALIEHNKPAAFGNPLWSLVCGLRMYGLWLTGRLKPELEKAGVP